MRYTICYTPKLRTRKLRVLFLSAIFFAIFLCVVKLRFAAELHVLRQCILSSSVQDVVTAFCQEILHGN